MVHKTYDFIETVGLPIRMHATYCRSAEKRKSRCEDELRSASEKIALLREEVATTTNSYDGQLSLMTEHLALMNDKVSSKTDEINTLRSQLSNKKNQKKK